MAGKLKAQLFLPISPLSAGKAVVWQVAWGALSAANEQESN